MRTRIKMSKSCFDFRRSFLLLNKSVIWKTLDEILSHVLKMGFPSVIIKLFKSCLGLLFSNKKTAITLGLRDYSVKFKAFLTSGLRFDARQYCWAVSMQ